MSATTVEFYRLRADEARKSADAATLVNVRERHLDAASAWDAMTQRAVRTLRARGETDARKAAAALAAAEEAGATPAEDPMPDRVRES